MKITFQISDIGIIAYLGLCISLQILQVSVDWDFDYVRRYIAEGAWWRLIIGQCVHSNIAHLLMNVAGLAGLYILSRLDDMGSLMIVSLFPILCLTGVLLYLNEPELERYVGLSGALHGCAALMGLALVFTGNRIVGWLLVAAIAVKLVWESSAYYVDTRTADMIGLRVAIESHYWGVVAGTLVWLVWFLKCRET